MIGLMSCRGCRDGSDEYDVGWVMINGSGRSVHGIIRLNTVQRKS